MFNYWTIGVIIDNLDTIYNVLVPALDYQPLFINTPEQNGHHFAGDIAKRIDFNDKVLISIEL